MNHASFARLPRRNRLLPVTEGTSCTSRRARRGPRKRPRRRGRRGQVEGGNAQEGRR